jgi:hypothetical protein
MADPEFGIVLAVLLLTVLGGVVLYVLVRAEHDQRERLDRTDAERAARRDDPEE